MEDNLECPHCGSHSLDDGTFAFNGVNGTEDFTPQPVHYECMECEWSGNNASESGDYQAMLEDKADGERDERMLGAWEETQKMRNHNDC